jgi:hypothetical protein
LIWRVNTVRVSDRYFTPSDAGKAYFAGPDQASVNQLEDGIAVQRVFSGERQPEVNALLIENLDSLINFFLNEVL